MTTVLVCCGGGHLKQLHRLVPRLELDDEVLWWTFDTALSRSLLAGQRFEVAAYAPPRDVAAVVRNAAVFERLVHRLDVSRCVSTGASLALSAFPSLLARGVACHYVESAARATGPSVTGRVVERTPGVRRYAQHRRWAGARWRYAGSVFDGFAPGPGAHEVRELSKVVVTLGTNESYAFRRLVQRLVELLPPGADVLWQAGPADVAGTGVRARASVPNDELSAAVREADLVVAHAGTGSVLSVLEEGRHPVLVPRLRRYAEHVDDHQVQIADEMAARGLATSRSVVELTEADLYRAAARTVVELADPPSFQLQGAAA